MNLIKSFFNMLKTFIFEKRYECVLLNSHSKWFLAALFYPMGQNKECFSFFLIRKGI